MLFATIAAASMAFVASTALNVSLSAIQKDLNARGADLLWISNSYVIVQASLFIVCGSLSDRYGRNRVCIIGMLLFGAASTVAGSATTVELLILARFSQGFGGAMLVPTSLAIVSSYFSDGRHGLAISIWSAFTLLTSGLGPFIGGVLSEMGLWRMVFYIHIPFGILAVLVLWRYVPETFDKNAPKNIPLSGAALITLSLLSITYGFLEAPQYGFAHPPIWLSILVGIIALVLFVWGEYRSGGTIMPLGMFRSRTFSGANLSVFLFYVAFSPVNLYIPLNMIQVQGYSESMVGIALLPMTLLMLGFSAYIGVIVDKFGPRMPAALGHVICAISFVMLAQIGISQGEENYFSTFFLPVCLAGIGLGITLPPQAVAVMAAAEESQAGIASGIGNTLSRVGQVLSVAIMGGVMLSLFSGTLFTNPAVESLPQAARDQLAVASVDLAETTIPQSLTDSEQAGVQKAIDLSFVRANDMLYWVGAAVFLLSGAVAWFMIDNSMWKRKEDFV